ncbi:MAG: alpha/beta hydrolase [Thermoflexales bacterium]
MSMSEHERELRARLGSLAVLELRSAPAPFRIPYGRDPNQFGDLYLPAGVGPHPVAVFIHGGYWRARYDIGNAGGGHMGWGLAAAGYAAWCLEYRRSGNAGGGWPGTFHDIAAGITHLRVLTEPHALDLSRVTLTGHSAGGHLALWYAGARRMPLASEIGVQDWLPVSRVVALAPVSDLRASSLSRASNSAADEFLGGTPVSAPDRFDWASPMALLPLGARTRVLHGTHDSSVPYEMSEAFVAAARAAGDDSGLTRLDGMEHFEVIDPKSEAWPAVLAAMRD